MKLNYFCGIGAELKRQRIDFDYMNQIYLYVLSGTETLTQVTTANFFNEVAVSLQPNDIIFIHSGANNLYTPYKVTKDTDNNVTLSELLNNSLKDLIDSLPTTIGNLLSDGSIPMDTGYTPTDDQDIATKKYVLDNAGTGNLKSDGSVLMDVAYTPTTNQGISTKKYVDDSIVGLGDLAFLDTVGETKIDNSAVTENKIANNAVTTNKILDAAITYAKLAAATLSSIADYVVGAARTYTGAQKASETALSSTSASIAVDFALNNDFTHTFTENTTLDNPTNIVAGQSGAIRFTQHASSPKTLAFGSYWDFSGGTAPAVTATNSARDTLFYHVRSSTQIEASMVKNWS